MAAVLPLSQVGLFSLGLTFAGIASMILMEINRAFLPQYSAESFPAPSESTRRVARLQIVAAVCVPILGGAIISSLSPLLVSEEYADALPLVAVLLLAQTMYGLYLIPANYTVQSAGHTSTNWYASVAGATFIFAAILLLGARTGAAGVSLFTLGGYFVMAVGAFFMTRRIRLTIRWNLLMVPWSFLALMLFAGVLAAWGLFTSSTELRLTLGLCSLAICIPALWSAKAVLNER